MSLCSGMHLDHGLNRIIYIPPELDDVWVGRAPGIDQRLELFFLKTHLKCTHSLESTDGSAIAAVMY